MGQIIFPGVPTNLTFAAYDHLDFAVLLALNQATFTQLDDARKEVTHMPFYLLPQSYSSVTYLNHTESTTYFNAVNWHIG